MHAEHLLRSTLKPLTLGLGAALVNAMVCWLWPVNTLPLGNALIFIAALALGGTELLLTFGLYILAEGFVRDAGLEVLRVLTLAGALHIGARYQPRLPGFFISFALWCLLFGPMLALARSTGWIEASWTIQRIVMYGLNEILLSMVAGALLLNGTIWDTVAARPRHVPLPVMLAHVLCLIATIALALALGVTGSAGSLGTSSTEIIPVFAALTALAVILPVVAGERLAKLITQKFSELVPVGAPLQAKQRSLAGIRVEPLALPEPQHLVAIANPLDASSETPGQPVEHGICALNRNGTVTFANRRFLKLSGLSGHELLGKQISALPLSHELQGAILGLVEQTFLKGPRVVELKVNQHPSQLRYFELESKLPENFEGSSLAGGPDSVIILLRDITDRRTIERHLLEAQKLSSLGAIVTDVVREFSNALTTITGQACVAKQAQTLAEVQHAVEEILTAAQRASITARQMMNFAEGGPSPLRKMDLSKLIDERLSFLQRVAGEECELRLSKPAQPLGVQCDPHLITQVLTNLVQNAREAYGDKPGAIELALDEEEIAPEVANLTVGAREGRFVRVRVRDQGVGMTADQLAQAFDPLYTSKASAGHAGLGLSIVYSVVRAHDGFLVTESALNKGTTVSIYLPRFDLTQDRLIDGGAPAQDGLTPALGNQEHILVVEDEPTVRELVATMLASIGYRVSTCGSGHEALERTRAGSFDLILVDMVMPRMRGSELLALLRADEKPLRTLMMTGYGITDAQAHMADNVIQKPFDLDTLARVVRSTLQPIGTAGDTTAQRSASARLIGE